MKSQWVAFGVGLAVGLGYVCTRQADVRMTGTPVHDQEAAMGSSSSQQRTQCQRMQCQRTRRQREQWLQQLQYHTSFSFPQQLMQPPEKMKHVSHEPHASSSVADALASVPDQSFTHEGDLNSSNLAQALQRALGQTVPKAVKHWQPAAPLPASTGSPWAIQVATHTRRGLAQQLQRQLIAKGHDARVVQGYDPSTHEVEYHVRLHGFSTQKQAQIYRRKFEQKEKGFLTFCLQQSSP